MKRLSAFARLTAQQDGFTLFEALIGVALMGFILSILAVITAQWVPHWQAGFSRLQRAETVSLGLDRVASDLAAAEFIAPIGDDHPLFYGSASSVTFVRTPIGPRSGKEPAPALEIIRLADNPDEGGLIRSRISFSPDASVAAKNDDFEFSSTSLLLRAPLRVSFAFAGPDRTWADAWASATALPVAVRITVRNADSDTILAVSTATIIHIDAPASCASNKQSGSGCGGQSDKNNNNNNNNSPQPSSDDNAKPAGRAVL